MSESPKIDLPQGTLDLLILKSLALEAQHGWAISDRIQQISKDALRVQQGSLYPALHRLERKGWITAEWGASENNRKAKFYALTQHNFSPLAIYLSDLSFNRMDPKLREGFLDAAQKAAADTRAHGRAVEKEALAALADKGVTIVECDKEAFRKRVLPQTDNFIKARPEAKPVIDMIRATQA